MVPFLPDALASDGRAVLLDAPVSNSDSVCGGQAYAGDLFGGAAMVSASAVEGTDVRLGGFRYTYDGRLRVYDATSALPSGAVTISGCAVSSDGQLCITTDAPDASATFIGGMAVRSDGAVYAMNFSPAAWFRHNTGITVTGSGVSQWDDKSGNARHVLQGTAANRPIALLHTGTNYLYLPGVTGNYASSPDSAGVEIAGDLDVAARVAMTDWTPSAEQTLISQYASTGNQRSWIFAVQNTTGLLRLYQSLDGINQANTLSSVAPTVSDGGALWVRVTRASSTGKVNFYQAPDSETYPTSWTAVGTEQTLASGALFNSTAYIQVGAWDGASCLAGKVYRTIIKSGIGGTTAVDFNASDATDQAASFVSSTTGETWTVNSTGTKPAQIVGSTRLLGDGAAHKMACSTYAANQPRTVYALVQALTWTAGDYIISGVGAEAGITQVTSTPTIGLNAGSAAASNGGLTLGAWKVVCAVINGASSSLRVNLGAAATGDAGANNPAGLTMFSNSAGTGYFNGMIRELIDFPAAHSTAQQDQVINYLMQLGGVT